MNFILLVLFLVILFLAVYFYAKLRDEIKNIKGRGIAEEVKKEIEGIIVEFNKVSNRKILVIEEKIKELEKLIKVADERILRLDTLTRNYAEIVKRYEMVRNELKQALSDRSFKSLDLNLSSKANQGTYTDVAGGRKLPKAGKLMERNQAHSLVQDNTLEDTRRTTESTKDEKTLLEEELKRIKIESLGFESRAELLRKLLALGFDESELVKMGFSSSEIEITKIVLSNFQR